MNVFGFEYLRVYFSMYYEKYPRSTLDLDPVDKFGLGQGLI